MFFIRTLFRSDQVWSINTFYNPIRKYVRSKLSFYRNLTLLSKNAINTNILRLQMTNTLVFLTPQHFYRIRLKIFEFSGRDELSNQNIRFKFLVSCGLPTFSRWRKHFSNLQNGKMFVPMPRNFVFVHTLRHTNNLQPNDIRIPSYLCLAALKTMN